MSWSNLRLSLNWSNLKLSQQGFILVGVPIGLMLVVLISLFWVVSHVEQQAAETEHTKKIIARANALVKEYYDAGSQLMIFKYTKSEKVLGRFEEKLTTAEGDFAELHKLLEKEPEQLELLENLKKTADKGMSLMREFAKRLQQQEEVHAIEGTVMYKRLNAAGTTFSEKLQDLVNHETQRTQRNAEEEERGRILVKLFILAGVVLAVALGTILTLLFTKNTTTRLGSLVENTVLLSKKEPLRPTLEGEDEIATLDRFFHQMALELAEATRKEKLILDNAVDVICSIDAQGNFVAVNPAAQQSWGVSPEQLIGQSYTKLIASENLQEFRETLERTRTESGSLNSVENRVITDSDERLDVQWSLRWSDSEKLFFCVAHDISDRKRVEQLKQDFVAMISHELRTPLTSMQAMLTLLANGAYGEITESGEKRLKSAKTGVNRLIMLINDLLDTEKLEAGKLSMTYKDVDLYNVVERSVETIEGFAEEHDVKVKVSNKPITVLGDSDRLIQVMVNLLSNAIKYSEEDGEIEVNIEEDEEECEVRIVDHGAGIPPGFEDKIFQRYEQAPSVDGKRRSGTGLGLPICKAIVEQHGGTIGVKQTEGGGSTFWFRIPRVGGSAEA
ncbi:MAG: hypothetical protein C0469_03110 [Cyanobacteria bacterium DS2.3.42]|nr:hypothetical protein [Cyanobacteria bacterium DS2.3.42]